MSAVIGDRCSVFGFLLLGMGAGSAIGVQAAPDQRVPITDHRAQRAALRVCSDPNNLPFSDKQGGGFENKIAELIARDMHARLEYTWSPQRRGFVKRTLNADECDLIIGVPIGYGLVTTTAPYYRSSYVFVSRAGSAAPRSLDDPQLRRARIGVALIGSHYQNTPPGHALAARGIVQNVVGYPVYGDYAKRAAPPELIDAVANGEIDVAIAWGPVAGYWASRRRNALVVTPIAALTDSAALPMNFEIALGVRRGDTSLAARLNDILARNRRAINSILDSYGIPRAR
ncbi:MAG: substrate-binding domain-containing protein [Gemmatimonadaceae bacterium]